MTTQKMYDEGTRCKGRGLNCGGCKDKNSCVEYTKTPFEEEYYSIVDVIFKDKTQLNGCAIFDEKPDKAGMDCIKDREVIGKKFQKFPWYSRYDGWIYFQNKYISGQFHVENVDSYSVKTLTKEQLRDL